MTENELSKLIESDAWIPLDEQLPPLNNIFENDCPIPFTTKGNNQHGAFICNHEEFLPGDEDILREMGVTHWIAGEAWETLARSINN
ncbi:TPA: hypothetical protein JI393_RS14335 [Acinetobacter baumannii]|uniref:hypothetical protein n=1 Tax=Acinetobacter indicus TaxID=756892 RepID=UPI000CEC518C|nr:hypothetical protein [Acinetobacter indicus]HBI1384556.1 hypothetical protein [Acinetobacter baumannii]HBI9064014.1 hypothetical protein [Acinetobacter baumannii]